MPFKHSKILNTNIRINTYHPLVADNDFSAEIDIKHISEDDRYKALSLLYSSLQHIFKNQISHSMNIDLIIDIRPGSQTHKHFLFDTEAKHKKKQIQNKEYKIKTGRRKPDPEPLIYNRRGPRKRILTPQLPPHKKPNKDDLF